MSDDRAALVPLRQESVNFYGDEIGGALVQVDDHPEWYVPVRPICEALGLTWSSQYMRINRDPVLAEAARSVLITRTEAGERTLVCLPLDMLPGWLFGLSESRVRPDLADKIRRYRRECFRVLWEHFRADIQPEAPTAGLTGTALAVEQARAILRLAEQQHELEQRFTTMADFMRGHVRQTNARLHTLELQLQAEVVVTDQQAAEISQAVKHIALAWAARDGANHYGAIYDALYKHFGVTSYKSVPRKQYQEVMDWLKAWFDRLNT